MKLMVIQVIHILVWIMEYGFVIQTMLIHINMVWNKIHGIMHELIWYAIALEHTHHYTAPGEHGHQYTI